MPGTACPWFGPVSCRHSSPSSVGFHCKRRRTDESRDRMPLERYRAKRDFRGRRSPRRASSRTAAGAGDDPGATAPSRSLPPAAAAASSSIATAPGAFTTTCASRSTACSPRGPSQGPHARPRRAPLRRPDRGPPDRVPRLRGGHPEGRVRRRRFHLLGLGHVRARADLGSRRGRPGGRAEVPPARGEAGRAVHPRPDRRRPQGRGPAGAAAGEIREDEGAAWLLIAKAGPDAIPAWDPEGLPRLGEDGPHERRGGRGVSTPGGQRGAGPPSLARSRRVPASRPAGFVEPMLATPGRAPFDGDDWLFEPKWDGYRVQAIVAAGRWTLRTRNRNDAGRYFPELLGPPTWLAAPEAIVDGEVVALDPKGGPTSASSRPGSVAASRPPTCPPVPTRRPRAGAPRSSSWPSTCPGARAAPSWTSRSRSARSCSAWCCASIPGSATAGTWRGTGSRSSRPPRPRARGGDGEAPPEPLRGRASLLGLVEAEGPADPGADRRRVRARPGWPPRPGRTGRGGDRRAAGSATRGAWGAASTRRRGRACGRWSTLGRDWGNPSTTRRATLPRPGRGLGPPGARDPGRDRGLVARRISARRPLPRKRSRWSRRPSSARTRWVPRPPPARDEVRRRDRSPPPRPRAATGRPRTCDGRRIV